MTNPTGRTHHYAEHPLSEPGGLEVAYRDRPRELPGRGPREWRPTNAGELRLEQLLSRHPLLTLGAGLAAGFLTAQCLMCLMHEGS
jgi:hypothetical protein